MEAGNIINEQQYQEFCDFILFLVQTDDDKKKKSKWSKLLKIIDIDVH